MALAAAERARMTDVERSEIPAYPRTRPELIIALTENYGMIYDGSNTSICFLFSEEILV